MKLWAVQSPLFDYLKRSTLVDSSRSINKIKSARLLPISVRGCIRRVATSSTVYGAYRLVHSLGPNSVNIQFSTAVVSESDREEIATPGTCTRYSLPPGTLGNFATLLRKVGMLLIPPIPSARWQPWHSIIYIVPGSFAHRHDGSKQSSIRTCPGVDNHRIETRIFVRHRIRRH